MKKGYENRYQTTMVSIEESVPQDHFLRQISAAVDFSKIYEFVEELYCDDNGKPSIDPVVLFKMVLIQHLYSLSSLRRTADLKSLQNGNGREIIPPFRIACFLINLSSMKKKPFFA